MKKTLISSYILIFLFSSCVKNIDTSIADDFSFTPKVKIALGNVTFNQNHFINNGVEQNTIIQDFISNLENLPLNENLTQVEIEFKISNSFDRFFDINFDFLDENDQVVHQLNSFSVPANSDNISVTRTIIIADSPDFLLAKKTKITLEMSRTPDGSTLDPNIEKNLNIVAGGTFYLNIE